MSLSSNDLRAIAYWDARADAWRFYPPVSPGPDDVDWYQSYVDFAHETREDGQLVALLLGVTPQIACLRWPRGSFLAAADWSGAMLQQVWQRSAPANASGAICADWRSLPIATTSVDLVLGDGVYSVSRSFDQAGILNTEVHRVLRRGGYYCVRAFARPERAESVDALVEALAEGRMRNALLFRWRFAMALSVEPKEGVRLSSVWEAWRNRVPDPRGLAARNGWSDDDLATFEIYRDVDMPLYFPTRGELRELAGRGFEWLDLDLGRYERGDLFPRIAMRAR